MTARRCSGGCGSGDGGRDGGRDAGGVDRPGPWNERRGWSPGGGEPAVLRRRSFQPWKKISSVPRCRSSSGQRVELMGTTRLPSVSVIQWELLRR